MKKQTVKNFNNMYFIVASALFIQVTFSLSLSLFFFFLLCRFRDQACVRAYVLWYQESVEKQFSLVFSSYTPAGYGVSE